MPVESSPVCRRTSEGQHCTIGERIFYAPETVVSPLFNESVASSQAPPELHAILTNWFLYCKMRINLEILDF